MVFSILYIQAEKKIFKLMGQKDPLNKVDYNKIVKTFKTKLRIFANILFTFLH